MRRKFGTVLVVAGAALLLWAGVVWVWQDPFTALYTRWEQHRLAQSYAREVAAYHPQVARGASLAAVRGQLRREAHAFRRSVHVGMPIGRIHVPRMHLNMIVINGTDESSLMKGPGRDTSTYMPGEGRLVYIAGHRTTYLAPFSHIDSLRPGDRVTLDMPYATFVYSVMGHRIVAANDVAMLKSHGHEQLDLQACHPRFFATHRYIAIAKLVSVKMRGAATPVSPTALAEAAQT
jgi:sortase A